MIGGTAHRVPADSVGEDARVAEADVRGAVHAQGRVDHATLLACACSLVVSAPVATDTETERRSKERGRTNPRRAERVIDRLCRVPRVLEQLRVRRGEEPLHAARREVDAREKVGERGRLREAPHEVEAAQEDLRGAWVKSVRSVMRPRGMRQ